MKRQTLIFAAASFAAVFALTTVGCDQAKAQQLSVRAALINYRAPEGTPPPSTSYALSYREQIDRAMDRVRNEQRQAAKTAKNWETVTSFTSWIFEGGLPSYTYRPYDPSTTPYMDAGTPAYPPFGRNGQQLQYLWGGNSTTEYHPYPKPRTYNKDRW